MASPRVVLNCSALSPLFDAAILARHDRPGPRYTSYPTAPQFHTAFGAAQLLTALECSMGSRGRRPLSLYLHMPFCFSPCFYCACTRLITRDTRRGAHYARQLLREAQLIAAHLGGRREVVQLHFGGGTPNFLEAATLGRVMSELDGIFDLSRSAVRDFSIELDPRSVPADYPARLAGLGFNRVSLGVQDFEPEVQRAVNRVQSIDATLDLIDACRDNGVRSVNVDLIYGLPRQTPAGFRRTLRTVVSARPDRLAVYGYAHLPGLFKAQRRLDPAALPTPQVRLELLGLAIDELTAAGYRYVGMDHFALPADDLVAAQEAGELQRNFMGYTTFADTDLVGLGMSAISHIGASFSQNFRDLRSWQGAVDAGRLPVWRGLALSKDDRIRGVVIGELMCHGRIDMAATERRLRIDFADYFGAALERLKPHVADGLVRIENGQISATATGRLLLRSLAMCFDAYLDSTPGSHAAPLFSKLV